MIIDLPTSRNSKQNTSRNRHSNEVGHHSPTKVEVDTPEHYAREVEKGKGGEGQDEGVDDLFMDRLDATKTKSLKSRENKRLPLLRTLFLLRLEVNTSVVSVVVCAEVCVALLIIAHSRTRRLRVVARVNVRSNKLGKRVNEDSRNATRQVDSDQVLAFASPLTIHLLVLSLLVDDQAPAA